MMSNSNYKTHGNSTKQLKALIDAHGQWIKGFLDNGWDGYLFSMTFNYLPGSRATKLMQMNQEVERLYGRLATRMVRNTRSPRWAGYCPIGVFIPDLPAPKSRKGQKSTIADVSINDGLHMHGIVLANRWGRVQGPLDEYFEENSGQFVRGKIRNIDVQPITHELGYVVSYGLKGLVKRTASDDDILVLDWGGSYSRPHRLSGSTRQFFKAVEFLEQANCMKAPAGASSGAGRM